MPERNSPNMRFLPKAQNSLTGIRNTSLPFRIIRGGHLNGINMNKKHENVKNMAPHRPQRDHVSSI